MADNNKNESLMNVENMEKFNACMKTLEEELMKNLTEIMMPTTTSPAKNPNPINTDNKINMPQAPTK